MPTFPVTPSPTPYVSQTACDNSYYPLRQGAEWKYEDGSTVTVKSVTGDMTAATAVIVTMSGDVPTYEDTVRCSSLGMIYEQRIFMPSLEHPSVYSVTEQDGVFFPSDNDVHQGFKWQYSYTETWVDWALMSSGDCMVVGEAPVEFNAVQLIAARVECSIKVVDTLIPTKGVSTRTHKSIDWYARGIGSVRQEYTQLTCTNYEGTSCMPIDSTSISNLVAFSSP